jgi:hypothetical protein
MPDLRRRQFITLLGGVAARGARAAVGGRIYCIGILGATSLLNAFRDGMRERGYVEGQNLAIRSRSATPARIYRVRPGIRFNEHIEGRRPDRLSPRLQTRFFILARTSALRPPLFRPLRPDLSIKKPSSFFPSLIATTSQ